MTLKTPLDMAELYPSEYAFLKGITTDFRWCILDEKITFSDGERMVAVSHYTEEGVIAYRILIENDGWCDFIPVISDDDPSIIIRMRKALMMAEPIGMDFDTIYRRVLEIFPGAQMNEDNDGQLIIYTDMKLINHNKIVPYEGENDDDGNEN